MGRNIFKEINDTFDREFNKFEQEQETLHNLFEKMRRDYTPNIVPPNSEKYDEEVFEVIKNGVKTTTKLYFNSKGMVVNHSIVSENILEAKLAALDNKLRQAIKTMDFETAIKIRDEIKNIKGSQ